MANDLFDVLESAYRFDGDDPEWLDGVARAMQKHIDPRRRGLFTFFYEITSDGRVTVPHSRSYDMAEPYASMGAQIPGALPAWYVRQTFAQHPCASAVYSGSAKARALTRAQLGAAFGPVGLRDIFIVNALDPTGQGVYIGAARRAARELPKALKTRWTRVAVHLASAWRLRRTLRDPAQRSVDAAEAVLAPDGKIVHARDDARARGAREALAQAARAIERGKSAHGDSNGDRAVAEWTGLVAARWSLVDHFESDGKRWLLARKNDVADVGKAELSPREVQAVAFAALGHTNKLIAYEMGITAETVRVLLHRAGRKLGASDRAELITRSRLTFTPTV